MFFEQGQTARRWKRFVMNPNFSDGLLETICIAQDCSKLLAGSCTDNGRPAERNVPGV
jgi:hypothetical protein